MHIKDTEQRNLQQYSQHVYSHTHAQKYELGMKGMCIRG